MRVKLAVAEAIARAAVTEPYRQTDLLTTAEFARWLQARGIELSWQDLHQLWAVGVATAVAARPTALTLQGLSPARFRPVAEDTLADLGADVPLDARYSASRHTPWSAREVALWHPLQLWFFDRMAHRLVGRPSLDAALRRADGYTRPTWTSDQLRRALHEFGSNPTIAAFPRVLALLVRIEPLFRAERGLPVRLRPWLDEREWDGFWDWVDAQQPAGWLAEVGLSLDEVRRWHGTISLDADLQDPLEAWRVLVRQAERGKRDRLKGDALRAHDLYDAAELLRRYAERYHGEEWPEEDDVRHGPRGAVVKTGLYGAPRVIDADRTVRRRISREFGVDPQARTTCLVEGATEEACLRRLAERLGVDLDDLGIEVFKLRGVGAVKTEFVPDLLDRLRREEVFAVVAVDHDGGGSHVERLAELYASGMLPIRHWIWEPDFEACNFTSDELAAAANAIIVGQGKSVTITGAAIAAEMATGHPAGKAVEIATGKAGARVAKGPAWGRALADVAFERPCPPELAQDARRPLVALFELLQRGGWSDYRYTVEHEQQKRSSGPNGGPNGDAPA